MRLTSHFELKEFTCKCGCGEVSVDADMVYRLEAARTIADIPFIINSGYRCEKHQEEVGRVTKSAHTLGKAVDIKCIGSRQRFIMVKALLTAGFNRIGIGKTYIHADVDTSKDPDVIWLYY